MSQEDRALAGERRVRRARSMCHTCLANTHKPDSSGRVGWPLPMRLSCPVYQLTSSKPSLSMALIPVVIG